jgi:glycosyltransferase involved in cell wall biosynthesis
MLEYSVVIPVYNGSQTLSELVKRLTAAGTGLGDSYEIIFVDDGSQDGSWDEIKRIKQRQANVRGFRLGKNFGQHNALMCGFNHARGKYVLTIDDDLQHAPEEIGKLIARIKKGYDVVYGLYVEKKHERFRNLGSRFVQWIYRKALGIKGEITSLRIIKAQIVKAICKYDKGFTYIDGLIAWFTRNIGYIRVNHARRTAGRSGYTFRKLFVLGMNMLTNFSTFPLQLTSLLGIIFSGLGFAMALFYLGRKLFVGTTVSGFATIIIAITLFAGIQLLVLGLIGEYLGRMHLNINSKPQFYITEELKEEVKE